ncbi:MAG TPA: Ada metal-binding domain-containing protein [Thermomicrobiales bacterium]
MLTREEMLARMLGSDPTANGQFIVAVRTTGIYCLPTCRPSRKPKPENVIFYATTEEARAAGFRPCKLCKPDDFYAGHHAEEALIERLAARVAENPGAYRSVGALAEEAAIGTSKLHELIRVHYHTTPATLLNRARTAAARSALLEGSRQIAEIAFAVGFESLSAFNENFRKQTAMTPLDYRRLRGQQAFMLTLPSDYQTGRILRYLGRDRQSVTERVEGNTYTTVLRITTAEQGESTTLVRVTFAPGTAQCQIVCPHALDPQALGQVHDQLLRTLGLTGHPMRFEAQIAEVTDLAPLLTNQRGLRVPLIPDPFNALVWAITGQQITLAFTYTLRRRLIERIGVPFAEDLYAPPTAEAVAALESTDLIALGFSRAKADYLSGAARAVADGSLPLSTLADKSATQIERTLLAVRGIGPWSAHYILMRHFGFLNCVPLGDAGLTAALQRFFALEKRPDKRETLALMARFSPYRSLATFHLWQSHSAAG